MNFQEFAAAHGLIVKHVEFGRWVRVATTDKPHHKNGSYKHMGDAAFIQNHATMPEVATWFLGKDSDIKIDRQEIARIQASAASQIDRYRKSAAQKAVDIERASRYEKHAYLDGKGFSEKAGLVYRPDDATNLLLIPMRVGKSIVGCQLIDCQGGKKFLFGQRCSGAEFVIGSRGLDVWCEGYATALSMEAVMNALKVQCFIHVCFSAGNMEVMAKAAGRGVVIADNDLSGTGEKAAKAIGLDYFMPPTVGDDFNDLHQSIGTFAASQIIGKFLRSIRRAA